MQKINLTLLFLLLLISGAVMAQSPQMINYQAVARDNGGNVLNAKSISLKISVTNGSTAEYVETFSGVTTNAFGLFSIQIGNGSIVSGTLSGIKWSSGTHYLKVEMDAAGGTSYTTMGTTQILSVPYSFYADKAGSADLSKNKLSDIGNVSGTPSTGQILKWNGSAWSTANDSIGGPEKLSGLTDVSVPGPAKGQVLKYNGAKWNAANDSTGPQNLSGLGDVSIPGPTKGQVLKYNGTKWVAGNDSVGTGGSGGSSQWTTSGSDIYYAKGKVGIGMTAPAHNLDIIASLPKANLANVYVNTKGNTNNDTSSGIASYFHGSNSTTNRNIGVSGYGFGNNFSGSNGTNIGLYGQADSSTNTNRGVYGRTYGRGSFNQALFGRAEGINTSFNSGLYGYAINSTGTNAGTWSGTDGAGANNFGVYGYATGTGTNNIGLYGKAANASTNNFAGFYDGNVMVASRGKVAVNEPALGQFAQMAVSGDIADSITQAGTFIADSGSKFTVGVSAAAVNSSAASNRGLEAVSSGGSTVNDGVFALANSSGSSNSNYAVFGVTVGSGGQTFGVVGNAAGSGTYNIGIYGLAGTGGTNNYAGYFNGDVYVGGTLSKSSGTFKIDHPQDPANKYLIHSFVESPDMMNVYNGNITTDANGEATVSLPEYFMALNKDYRYQLTVIGTFAQAIVFEKVKDNHFKIKTDKPDVEVSWQVTGIRQDPYAVQHPIIPVVEKQGAEKGRYLNPELYGKPASLGMLVRPAEQKPSVTLSAKATDKNKLSNTFKNLSKQLQPANHN